MSPIFEGVLETFKLNKFQPNYKYSSLRACADHPKCHQGHQLHSGTSTPARTIEISSIFEGILFIKPKVKQQKQKEKNKEVERQRMDIYQLNFKIQEKQ